MQFFFDFMQYNDRIVFEVEVEVEVEGFEVWGLGFGADQARPTRKGLQRTGLCASFFLCAYVLVFFN